MLQFSRIGGTVASAACGALITAAQVNAAGLDEITVSARKTTENLQEVPLSIKAISAEQIDRLGLKDISNIATQDTSVQFDLGFAESDTKVIIRGLSPTRGRPNVATLIDGIDVSSEAVTNSGGSLLINPRMIDVESVEIVKGPQSALYGRSAFAGAIQYITKDPDEVFSGGAFVDYNLEGDEEIRGNISIPLSDTFGMRINGAAWRKDGYYNNAATGEPLGDGDGAGVAVTFKWEPTDNFSAKWRTDYADDAFGPAPQALLNEFSTLYDLGNSGHLNDPDLDGIDELDLRDSEGRSVVNLVPMTNACNPVPGPVDSYDCGPGQALDAYLRDLPGAGPSSSFIYGALGNTYPDGFGLYDATDPWIRNIYNKQVIQSFTGKIPDGKFLTPSLMPDYRKSANPLDAEDFEGSTRRVFRNSLNMDWDINENVVLSSYTGFTDAKTTSQMDLGKFYVDECRPGADQAGKIPELRQQNDCTAGDGIHDGGGTFMQDNVTETKQFSQEFRVAWDISEDLSFTQGIQYWRERVKQDSYTQITLTADAFCFLSFGNPFLGTPYDFAFGPLTTNFQCGITTVPAAYFASKTYETVDPPIVYKRGTDHYSWYGNLQWDITDKFRATLEARLTREESSVAGPVMNVCLGDLSQDYLDNPDDPDNGIVSPFRDAYTGFALCEGYLTNTLDGGALFNLPNATNAPTPSLIIDPMDPDFGNGPMSGRIDGPTSYIICGFTGRCDMLESAPGGSPGNPGSFNAFGYDRANYTMQGLSKTDRYWAPKATLEYFWNDDVMTYFSWSRGIKPGGFNLVTAGQFGLDGSGDGVFDEIDFTSERLDVWELGAKTTTMNGRLRVNGALFFQDFKDKQIGVQEIIGNVVGTRIRNISGSEVKGLELDASFQFTDNLVLSGGWTYLNSEYTDYTTISESPNDIARVQLGNGKGCLEVNETPPGSGDPFCTLSYNGNNLERSPKHAVILNAEYTNSLLDTGLEWFGLINYSWQDMRWLESFNIVELPSYSRTNVSAGIVGDNWDIQLYINNVFDDDTITSAGGNPGLVRALWRLGLADGAVAGPKIPNDVFVNMPAPRILGARFNWRFGT